MAIPYSLQLVEAWQAPERLLERFGDGLPPRCHDALAYNGSLTRYLEQEWGEPVAVRLESQQLIPGWEEVPLLWDDRHDLPVAGQVMERNAWLLVGGQDLVFAHSQVGLSGLDEPLRSAIEQGEQPLGALFRQLEEEVGRARLELALVRSPQLARKANLPTDRLLWCRRSLLNVGAGPRARVLEVFLGER